MKYIKLSVLLIFLWGIGVAGAQVRTYMLGGDEKITIDIKTNEFVQVLFYDGIEFTFLMGPPYIFDGIEYYYEHKFAPSYPSADVLKLPMIAGPAKIIIGALGEGIITLKTTSSIDAFTPTGTMLLPDDTAGEVNVVLESSADLKNWASISPGMYDPKGQSRYFRVRGEYMK